MKKDNTFWIYWKSNVLKNKDIISLMFSICTLIQTSILYWIYNKYGQFLEQYHNIFYAGIIVLFFVMLLSFLIHICTESIEKSVDEFSKAEKIKCCKRDLLTPTPQEYQKAMKIISLNEIEDIESNISKDGKIWVLTSNVNLETTISTISQIILDNLSRSIEYKYFIPNTRNNAAKFLELHEKYKEYPTFQILKIDEKYKLLFENFDVIIYYPNKNHKEGRKAFICIKFSDNENEILFRQLSEEDTENLVSHLIRIEVEESLTC